MSIFEYDKESGREENCGKQNMKLDGKPGFSEGEKHGRRLVSPRAKSMV